MNSEHKKTDETQIYLGEKRINFSKLNLYLPYVNGKRMSLIDYILLSPTISNCKNAVLKCGKREMETRGKKKEK